MVNKRHIHCERGDLLPQKYILALVLAGFKLPYLVVILLRTFFRLGLCGDQKKVQCIIMHVPLKIPNVTVKSKMRLLIVVP